MFTVAEIMTREPYTLTPDHSLADARNLMAQHHIRHVPIVTGDGVVAGIVSQRDVLAAEDSSVINDPQSRGARDQYVALSSIMTSPAQTIDEHASLRGTAIHLHKNRLGCLPVLRAGKLIGIITDADFVAIAINLMEQLEATEPEEPEFGDDG
jgi:CBS domain-containing protein